MKKARQRIALTNGYLLNAQITDSFLEAGIKIAEITYFATPKEQNKWQRVKKEEYLKLRNNIENAVKRGLKVFINNVLWKANIPSIDELAKQCFDMGVERIKFIRFRPDTPNNQYITAHDIITDQDMNVVVENIEKAKVRATPRLQLSFNFAGPNFYGKNIDEIKKMMSSKQREWPRSPFLCPAIDQNYWAISPKQGEIYWCYFLKRNPFGKIGEVDIVTGKVNITNKIDLRPETLTDKLRGRCSKDKCEYQSICLGGCRSNAYIFANRRGEENPLYSEMDSCQTKVYERVYGK